MTIVTTAGIADPSDWNLPATNGQTILRTEELTPDKVVHLRGKITVEVEDRTVRFEIHEDEPPTAMMHQLHRSLQTDPEYWVIVTAHGDLLQAKDQLFPGRKHYMTQVPLPRIPIVIQAKLRSQEETLANVLLAIQLAFNLPLKWELRDQKSLLATSKEQLVHKHAYQVLINSKLIRTDRNGVSWKCFLEDLEMTLQQIGNEQNAGRRRTDTRETSERRRQLTRTIREIQRFTDQSRTI
jgi:hypothetical protein